jgi:hypothetical protein
MKAENTRAGFPIDQVMMMVLMTTLTPLITSFATAIINALTSSQPSILAWFKKLFGPKYHSVTIRRTMTYSEKTSYWAPDPDENHNHHLIHALLEFMSASSVYPDNMRCNLGMPNHDTEDNVQYMKSRGFESIPTTKVKYGDFYINYSQSSVSNAEKAAEKRTTTITISSKKSVKVIEEFVRGCYDAYINTHYGKIDNTQYMYKQMPSKDGVRFKKYPIHNETSFDRIFFPEKEKIMEMIEKLNAGELRKLSLMLHGKPGCGKTSVIKALAKKLGYHVIEVKLSFMMNDAALMDIFHNKAVMYYKNNDEKFSLMTDYIPLNKRIYIFEDVDAECDVIHQRKEAKPETKQESSSDKSPVNEKSPEDELYKEMMKRGLTLSGVLNVLDGVLELNGAVLVLTTNHLEKLDDAFTRPGRITMTIELKRMLAAEANKLIKNYFDGVIDNVHDYVFTPASLEAYCQAATDISELKSLIEAVQKKSD